MKDKNGKPIGGTIRPPARLFNYDEVRKVYGKGSVKAGPGQASVIFDGDEYEDGFCLKDIKIAGIETENVKPTLEEVARFQGTDEDEAALDLTAIQDANKTTTVSGMFPGDKVEVYEGEQAGLQGRIEAVTEDVITIRQETAGVSGLLVDIDSKYVRKRFDEGEHVKVLNGKNKDASGMVVHVKGDVVTIMSDQGEQEVCSYNGIELTIRSRRSQGISGRRQMSVALKPLGVCMTCTIWSC